MSLFINTLELDVLQDKTLEIKKHLANNQLVSAKKNIDSTLAEFPNNREIQFYLAIYEISSGNINNAIKLLQEITTNDPYHFSAWVLLSQLIPKLDPKAIRRIQQLFWQQRDGGISQIQKTMLQFILGKIALSQKNHEQALDFFEKVALNRANEFCSGQYIIKLDQLFSVDTKSIKPLSSNVTCIFLNNISWHHNQIVASQIQQQLPNSLVCLTPMLDLASNFSKLDALRNKVETCLQDYQGSAINTLIFPNNLFCFIPILKALMPNAIFIDHALPDTTQCIDLYTSYFATIKQGATSSDFAQIAMLYRYNENHRKQFYKNLTPLSKILNKTNEEEYLPAPSGFVELIKEIAFA